MTTAALETTIVRPVTLDDAGLVTDLLNACSQAALGLNTTNIEELTQEWQYPGFDLATESRLMLDEDGRAVAYGAVFNRMAPYVRVYAVFRIHPDYQQDADLGRDLLTWIEETARLKTDKAPADAQITLNTSALSAESDLLAHLDAYGMALKRHFFMMQVDLDAAPVVPALPEGMSITTLADRYDLAAMVKTTTDSFRDHYGFVETPYEEEYQDWVKWIESLEVQGDFDANLWFLLNDSDSQAGEAAAGVCICMPGLIEDRGLGYVEILGIRREWRRRGLALTLLLHSFAVLWERGFKKVALHVDASSLTGATRLYEKAGMRVVRQFDSYQLVLREGVDLSTQTLAE